MAVEANIPAPEWRSNIDVGNTAVEVHQVSANTANDDYAEEVHGSIVDASNVHSANNADSTNGRETSFAMMDSDVNNQESEEIDHNSPFVYDTVDFIDGIAEEVYMSDAISVNEIDDIHSSTNSVSNENNYIDAEHGEEVEVISFDFKKVVETIANDPHMKVRLEVYLYSLETFTKQAAYKRFRDLSVVHEDCLQKNLDDLARSVRSTWGKMMGYKVAKFKLTGSGKILKVPYLPLLNVAGLVCGSPSHLQEMLDFNEKFIEPFIDDLDNRIAVLEAAANTRGVDEIGFSPGLLKLLKRTETYWRPNRNKYREEGVTILWDCKMHFSDGFSFMGKASQKNQWGKRTLIM